MDQGTDPTSLSELEQAYMDTGGQTEIPAETKEVVEADADIAEASEQERAPQKMVPLPALHEERTKRKETEERMRRVEDENRRYYERFKFVEEQQKQQESRQEAPPPPPSPDEDIFGHAKHVGDRVQKLEQTLQQQSVQQQEAQQRQAFVQNYANDANHFAQEKKDFWEAYRFLSEGRHRELEAIGYVDLAERQKMIEHTELEIAQQALRSQRRPAAAIYALAEARGYKPATVAELDPDATERLANIQQGQQANRSLSAASGSGGGDSVTVQALLKMPMNEFEAWTKKNPAKTKRLMGG